MGRPKVEYSRAGGGKSLNFYVSPDLYDAIKAFNSKTGINITFLGNRALIDELATRCGCDPDHILDRDEDGNFINIR